MVEGIRQLVEKAVQAIVTKVLDVRKHPDADRLTIVTVEVNGEKHEVVANLHENGTPRWFVNQPCVYVPENAIVPEDVLKERGYWVEGEKKGLLGGSKGNRVKMQRFAGFESRGLLFNVNTAFAYSAPWIARGSKATSENPFGSLPVEIGDDVSDFLGITEYVAA